MGLYRTTNENIKDILSFLIGNDEIKRLLFYNEDPLNIGKPIPTKDEIMYNNLFPYIKIPTPETKVKSFICVYLDNSRKAGVDNIYQRDAYIYIDVLCHEEVWDIKKGELRGDIRPLIILDNIDIPLPKIETESIRGNLVYVDDMSIHYNDRFHGYRLIYTVTNDTEECDE